MRARQFGALALLTLIAASPAPPTTQPTLQEWIERYANILRTEKVDEPPPLAKIICVTDEERWNGGEFAVVVAESCISDDGLVRQWVHSMMGTKGFGAKVDNLKQFKEALRHLPAGDKVLPPPDRRVLIKVGQQAFVYDRGNLPAEVLDVCTIGHAMVGAWTPSFEPKETVKITNNHNDGALALSRDGKTVAVIEGYGQRTVFDLQSHKVVDEAKCKFAFVDTFSISPDRQRIAIDAGGDIVILTADTWASECQFNTVDAPEPSRLVWPTFTADSRVLLCSLYDMHRPLRAYDPHTGKPAAIPSYIPADATRWVENASGSQAVFSRKDDSAYLWDIKAGKEIAKLTDHVRVDRVSFSPDESMIAVSTRSVGDERERYGVALWGSKDGKLLHQLLVAERGMYDPAEAILWTADSQHVLVATKQGAFFDDRVIGVWNAATGRQRGAFEARTFLRPHGVVISPDARQLVAADLGGNVYFWDFASAMDQIHEFERSLAKKRD